MQRPARDRAVDQVLEVPVRRRDRLGVVILHRRYWTDWLGPAETQPPLEPLPAGSLKVEQLR